MPLVKTHPPQGLFRAAVLLGAVALLLGVAGIFYFGDREAERRRALRPDAATVLVRGLASLEGVEVEAHWEADGVREAEAGCPGPEAGTWHFAEAPEGVPLMLHVLRRRGTAWREQARLPAILTRGAIFEAYVARERR